MFFILLIGSEEFPCFFMWLMSLCWDPHIWTKRHVFQSYLLASYRERLSPINPATDFWVSPAFSKDVPSLGLCISFSSLKGLFFSGSAWSHQALCIPQVSRCNYSVSTSHQMNQKPVSDCAYLQKRERWTHALLLFLSGRRHKLGAYSWSWWTEAVSVCSFTTL